MKKKVIILTALLFILPLISSVQINMSSEFSQGETIIASVQGDLLEPLSKTNFEFYRGYVRTSFDYDVAKLGENYFFYIQLGSKLPNNYSVIIKNVRYLNGTKVITEDITKNFTITQNKADFLVNPGFVVTSENFSLKLQNLQSSQITINIDTETNSGAASGLFDFFFNNQDIENSVTLLPERIDYIDIILENITETTIRTITLSTENSTYKIPVYIILQSQPEQNQTQNETDTQEELNETINETEEEECSWIEKFFGLCNEETPEEQPENQTQEQNQTQNETDTQEELNETINETEQEEFNETQEENETEKGYEIIEEEDGSLTIIENGTIVKAEASLKTCEEMKGDVCGEGEICNTKTVYAKDNKCCITACVKQPENQNTRLIAGVIIVALILIVLWFFKSKFSKTKHKKDTLLGKK